MKQSLGLCPTIYQMQTLHELASIILGNVINLSSLPLEFLSSRSTYCVINWHNSNSKLHMSKFYYMNCYDHSFLNHMSFRSSKGTHYLNQIRYHGTFIENICWHQPPSIVIQPRGICDHIKVSPISQSLLLILAQTQYPLIFIKFTNNYVLFFTNKSENV